MFAPPPFDYGFWEAMREMGETTKVDELITKYNELVEVVNRQEVYLNQLSKALSELESRVVKLID